MSAALHILSLLSSPPDWLTWARPATERERGDGVDVVLTLDLGQAEDGTDRGVARVCVGVRWIGEPTHKDVATWRVARGETAGAPFVRWAKDIRRDLQRRHARHGQAYTEERVHILDARGETHRPR